MTKKRSIDVKQQDIPKQEERHEGQPDVKYPVELLIKSATLKSFGLHQDVLRAILTGKEYTIEHAKSIIQKYVDSFAV